MARTKASLGKESNTEPKKKRERRSRGNPACPRDTPAWQKPITNFFKILPKAKKEAAVTTDPIPDPSARKLPWILRTNMKMFNFQMGPTTSTVSFVNTTVTSDQLATTSKELLPPPPNGENSQKIEEPKSDKKEDSEDNEEEFKEVSDNGDDS